MNRGAATLPIVMWPPAQLRPNPAQLKFEMPELAAEKFEQLKVDIDKNGLEHPLDIWPVENGYAEVLGGHERCLAVMALGWTQVPVRVRTDLDSVQKREEFLLRDNLFRKHFNESQRAHVALMLMKVRGSTIQDAARDLNVGPSAIHARKVIAEATKETPLFKAIEAAADAGKVHLQTAARAATLPGPARKSVARRFKPDAKKANKELAELARDADRATQNDMRRSREAQKRQAAKDVALRDLRSVLGQGTAADVLSFLELAADEAPPEDVLALTRQVRRMIRLARESASRVS